MASPEMPSPSPAEKTIVLKPKERRPRRPVFPHLGRRERVVEVGERSEMTFLPSGKAALDAELDIIRNPTVNEKGEGHVYVQSFTFGPDEVGMKFVSELKQAAIDHPNVRYSLMVDHISMLGKGGNGSRIKSVKEVRKLLTDLQSSNVQVVITNQFNFFGINENPFHRNHQKLCSDGTRAVLLTANIADEHERWLDAGFLFKGPIVGEINEIMANTFGYARRWRRVYATANLAEYFKRYGPQHAYTDIYGAIVRNADDRGQKITLTSDNHGEKQEIDLLTDSFYSRYQEATNAAFSMIEQAGPGSVVDILTPYPGLFTLTKKMLKARENGATVNLHIPSNNDYLLYNSRLLPGVLKPFKRFLEPLSVRNLDTWKEKLKAAGITLYEYVGDEESNGMAHVKSVLVTNPDGKSGKLWFGTSNLNKGFFAGMNREIAVILSDEKALAEFREFVARYRSKAEKIF